MMKKIMLLSVLIAFAGKIFAQKQTFDLITFAAPKGWTKNVEETLVSYTITNNKKNTWCRINIIKSTVSIGTIEADFESEWQGLIVKNYKPTDSAQSNEIKEMEARLNDEVGQGWKIKAGGAKFIFNNSDALVMLTTMSGYNRCASIVAITNSEDYIKNIEAFLASVDLIKPEIASPPTAIANDDENSIIGIWGITASDQNSVRVNNGVAGTIFRQYSFNANGTYIFIIKTFDPLMDKILLGIENGTYQISGNTISVQPTKSVLEAWSKKNFTDWGKLLSTQNIAFEKTSYQFTKRFITEINEWQLVLQAATQTLRDGPFTSSSEGNAWIYIVPSSARPIIKLPGE